MCPPAAKRFAAVNTIYRWFATFRDEGRFEKINPAMVMLNRERVGGQASPTAGEKPAKATLIAVEIVRKNSNQVGFAVQPRRLVVERFFACSGRNRRLAKNFEANIDSARAFLYAASVMLFVLRIARAS